MALSEAFIEWEKQTEVRGIERGERSLIFRLLNRRIGELSESARSQIELLSIEQLESLGEALLDFSSPADLDRWLCENQ